MTSTTPTQDTISIDEFVGALIQCMDDDNPDIDEMFEEESIRKSRHGWESLCTHLGPEKLMENCLKNKNQYRGLCDILGIEYTNEHKIIPLRNLICKRIIGTTYPIASYSFVSLQKYIRAIKYSKSDNRDEKAKECTLRIEKLLMEVYLLFSNVLYDYVDEKRREFIRNTIAQQGKKLTLGSCTDQLESMERNIVKEIYPNAWEKIMELSGLVSIFNDRVAIGTTEEEKEDDEKKERIELFENIRELAYIRNNYIGHLDEQANADRSVLREKYKRIFKLAGDITQTCCEFLPTIIFPVQFGINEWGVRWIAYITEYDLDQNGKLDTGSIRLNPEDGSIDIDECDRFYLIRESPVFFPYQKAYCFYPTIDRTNGEIPVSKLPKIMYDPKIYYTSQLIMDPE